MAEEVKLPDLIPWDLAPEVVLSPERLLKHQADLIKEKSGGRLNGVIEREEDDRFTTLRFLLEAPSLMYSVRLFECWHKVGMPYPVTLQIGNNQHGAISQEAFTNVLKDAFNNSTTRSVFQSLLARIGEH
jgi:hypothetical protein